MNILVIGGSGYVAGLTLPFLSRHHRLRVFDLRPPADAALEYFAGNVGDYQALARAAEGMDALLYMAMGKFSRQPTPEVVTGAFDVNVRGVFLALQAAHNAG